MFARIVRATFDGLLAWPDLMVYGLLAFVLSFGLQTVFTPLWDGISAAQTSVVLTLALVIFQQFVLTLGSYVILVAATRLILSRMRGEPMSLRESAQIQPYMRPIMTYSAVYTLISSVLAIMYLVLLFGPSGLVYASQMMTSGVTGLTQVSTEFNSGAVCLVLLVFLPLLIGWSLANMLVGPVIAAEKIGGLPSIQLSWQLVRRTMLVVLWLVVSLFTIGIVIGLFSAYMTPDGGVSAVDSTPPHLAIFTIILGALLFILGAIFNAAWYLEAIADEPAE